jgi:hypothetical protein
MQIKIGRQGCPRYGKAGKDAYPTFEPKDYKILIYRRGENII